MDLIAVTASAVVFLLCVFALFRIARMQRLEAIKSKRHGEELEQDIARRQARREAMRLDRLPRANQQSPDRPIPLNGIAQCRPPSASTSE